MGRRLARAPVVVPPEQQPDATINITNPVSGTKYEWESPPGTPLGTQKNVRIVGVAVRCTWTAQPSPIEVHLTIDGVPFRYYFNDPASDTWYFTRYHQLANSQTDQVLDTLALLYYALGLFEGRTIKVQAEITGGTVSNLFARVKWAKWP